MVEALWDWPKNTQIRPWDRTESPETDPHKNSQLVNDRRGKDYDEQNQSSQQAALERLGIPAPKINLEQTSRPS